MNEDIILNIPMERRWIMEVYDIEAAFLNVDPEGCTYIKTLDEMVDLGFMTKRKQEVFAILLDKTIYGNVDVALKLFEKYSGIF